MIRRAIDKWLKAGVLEDGSVSYRDLGTPQGGVISPLLANVYLHEVMDKWFANEVKPRLAGEAHLVRYADDLVLVFTREGDARRVMEGAGGEAAGVDCRRVARSAGARAASRAAGAGHRAR